VIEYTGQMDTYQTRKHNLVDGDAMGNIADKFDSSYISKNLDKIYKNAVKDFTIDYNNLYGRSGTHGMFDLIKDDYCETILKDKYVNKMYEDVKKTIEEIAEMERQKSASCMIPVVGFPLNGPLTGGTFHIVRHAVNTFNATIPREGVPVKWGSIGDEGTLWGIDFDNASPSILNVRLTLNPKKRAYGAFPDNIRVNGIRKLRKTDQTLSELVIERVFAVDKHGKEITVYSI